MSLNTEKSLEIIDKANWINKEQFDFYSSLDNPNHSLTTEIDCTFCYQEAKANGYSFFASYLYRSLCVANDIEEFKLRIKGDQIVKAATLNGGSTVLRADHSFGFAFIEFDKTFSKFTENVKNTKIRIENKKGLCVDETAGKLNVIYYSVIPWIHFSGLTFAENIKTPTGIPMITFGKLRNLNNRFTLPISINVHHGLVNGYALGNYLEKFQDLLNSKI